MIYVLVAVVVCAIVFVAWRLVGSRPGDDTAPARPRRSAPRGPDDDPDFLRSLDR